ncbi:periplasmic binding protein-like I [Blastocladiella britannica]|nr:periplasmic binding protein-like I [Blastocladiella britannica]
MLDRLLQIVNYVANDYNTYVAHPRGFHFTLDHYDSKFTRNGAAIAASTGVANGAVGFIGEWASRTTIPAVLAASYSNAPICSGAATSDELSSREDFPRFFRTLPPDSASGRFLAQLCKLWKWDTVVLVASNEAYGLSLAATFQAQASQLGLDIARSYLIQTTWEDADYALLASEIRSSPTRIIVMLSETAYFLPLFRASLKAGFSTGWTWLGSDGLSELPGFILSSSMTAAESTRLNGLVICFPAEAAPGSTRFDSVAARWAADRGNDWLSSTPFALFTASCFEVMATAFMQLVDRFGYASVASRTSSASYADYLIDMDTVTGMVKFDEIGDRDGAYYVQNFVRGAFNNIYRSNANGTLTALSVPVFPDGTSTIPLSHPVFTVVIPDLNDPGILAITILTAIAIAILVATWSYLYYHRRARRVKHIGIHFTSLLCIGIIMTLVATFLLLGTPTRLMCAAQHWTLVLGMSLSMSSLFARSYRIYKVFDNRILAKSHSLNLKSMVLRMLVLPLAQLILLALQQVLDPLLPTPVYDVMTQTAQIFCAAAPTSNGIGNVLLYSAFGIDGLLLLMLAAVSWKIRLVHTTYNDTVFTAYAIHNLILTALIWFPLHVLLNLSTTASVYVQGSVTIYASCVLYFALLARHAIALPERTGNEGGQMIESTVNNGSAFAGSQNTHTGTTTGKVVTITGTFPTKPTTGLFTNWVNKDLLLHVSEGILTVFKSSSEKLGVAYVLRRCTLEPESPETPGCLVLTSPGSAPIMIQFPTSQELQRWLQHLSLAGAVFGDRSLSSGSSSGSGRLQSAVGRLRTMSTVAPRAVGLAVAVNRSGSMQSRPPILTQQRPVEIMEVDSNGPSSAHAVGSVSDL